jgi:hypothetical protein
MNFQLAKLTLSSALTSAFASSAAWAGCASPAPQGV